jgi:tetratricopeptide (TPR) repeat protein
VGPSDWVPGDRVAGVYTIVRELGRGGMGVVHLARSAAGLAAIKSPSGKALADEASRRRFTREATLWLQLGRHPHIVRAFDVAEIDSIPRIFMEYADAGSLAALVDGHREGMPLDRGLDLASQIARGMAYAHGRDVLHRDLKPANVLLMRDGTAKLADFGLAKELGAIDALTARALGVDAPDSAELTSGACVGTPPYMAPEQWDGAADPAVDVYAFGVILYEIFAGRRPLDPSTAPFPTEIRRDPEFQSAVWRLLHRRQPAPDPRSLRADLPDRLARLIRRCVAKRMEERPGGFEEVDTELEGIAREAGAALRPRPDAPALGAAEKSDRGWALIRTSMAAHFRGDRDDARRALEAARELLAAAGDSAGLAACALNLAGICFTQGDAARAESLYRDALAMDPSSAACLLGLGTVLQARGEWGAAQTRFEEALHAFERTGDEEGAGNALLNLGNLARDRGEPEAARLRYREALARAGENPRRRSGPLIGLGLVAWTRGDPAEARGLLEEARSLATSVGDRMVEARCLVNLGGVAESTGDAAGAERHLTDALGLAQEIGDRPTEGVVERRLGALWRERGELARAAVHLRRAAAMARELGRPADEAAAEIELGQMADREGAAAAFGRALEAAKRLGDRSREAHAELLLGGLARQAGDLAGAEARYRRALELYEAAGNRQGIGAACGNLGSLHGQRGEAARAVELLEKARAAFEAIGDSAQAGGCLLNLGNAHRAAGDRAKAADCYARGIEIWRRLGRAVPVEFERALKALE